jgi:hypothetical protein
MPHYTHDPETVAPPVVAGHDPLPGQITPSSHPLAAESDTETEPAPATVFIPEPS